MITKEKVIALLNEILTEDEFIVELDIQPGNELTIFIDSENGLKIGRCGEINHLLYEEINKFEEDFELSISSAGIDLPFRHIRQYKKNVNRDVAVTTKEGLQFNGLLKNVDDSGITLTFSKTVKEGKKKVTTTEEIFIDYSKIKTTKLIF
jgi:ribosome maturation factor RimP